MAKLTGNLEVDYVLTVIFSLIQTTITSVFNYIQLFFATYPDIAGILLLVIGAIVLFFVIKNAVIIIYNLIVTTVKLILLLSVVFVGSWVYFRGVDNLYEDAKCAVGYVATFDGSSLKALHGHADSLKRNYDAIVEFAKEVAHDEF